MGSRTPFFIVGCVRCGTTLLRNILRQHPNLCCPEETQFFRWGHPFRTKEFVRIYTSGPLLRKHREIDGVPEDEYLRLLETSTSRGSFMQGYLDLFRRARNMENRRVFDKSPQNIYGIPLIKDAFPDAKFVSMVRNPLNVVASLREGKVIHVHDLIGACAYWNEAMGILDFCKAAIPDDVHIIRYEDFLENTPRHLRELLEFVGEEDTTHPFMVNHIKPEKNRYRTVLSETEARRVWELCGRWMLHFQYAASEHG